MDVEEDSTKGGGCSSLGSSTTPICQAVFGVFSIVYFLSQMWRQIANAASDRPSKVGPLMVVDRGVYEGSADAQVVVGGALLCTEGRIRR